MAEPFESGRGTILPHVKSIGLEFSATHIDASDAQTTQVVVAPAPDILSPDETDPRRLHADDIYPSSEFGPPALVAAMRLLREVRSEVEMSLGSSNAGEVFDADDHLNRALVLLRETLPSCREAGDGFGIVISAALCSIANLGGEPATHRQTLGLKRLLQRLAAEPYLSSEQASEISSDLETEGLNPDPPGFAEISRLLSDE